MHLARKEAVGLEVGGEARQDMTWVEKLIGTRIGVGVLRRIGIVEKFLEIFYFAHLRPNVANLGRL